VDVVGSGPGEITEFDGVDAPKDTAAKAARLDALKLLKLQITYGAETAPKIAAGRLVSAGPEYAVLEAENQHFAVPLAVVRQIQVLEKPLRVHVAFEKPRAPPAPTKLGMAYLRKGVTWIPEYTLRLLDDDTAELTLRGTLVNEAEDIVGCDVNFVVGVPNFLHTDFMAPIAVGQVIRTIGAAVAPREVMTQMMNRAAIASDIRADQFGVVERPVTPVGDVRAATGNLPQLEGAGADDFTVYTRKNLTLRRGEKAIVTLFTRRIKYGHVYRWSPPGDIRHLLVLHNDTDTAWTTGPCLAFSGGTALSEDLLKYIPKGGRGEFPVTTAINIAHDCRETEVERKMKALELSSNFWVDLVTLEGELTARNFGKAPAELLVDLPIAGVPLSASDDGLISLDTANLKLMERTGNIRWRLTLQPDETKRINYRCQRYVPTR